MPAGDLRAAGRLPHLLGVVLVATAACGSGNDDARCMAKLALRDAVRAVDQAEAAETTGNANDVRQQINETTRLIGIARRNLSRSTTNSVERGMLEAAEYLEFIVSDYRATGAVDGTLAQFALRELNRSPSPGEAPLNC